MLKNQALWVPQNKPQWLAHLSRADELFYGGAAGGGKTDLGLGECFECHQRSMFFRNTYADLTDVVDRGNQIAAPLGIVFNQQRRRWEFPDGRFVQLGAIDHPDEVRNYQGRARDLLVFDEASFFAEAWIRYISGWLRSTDPQQRIRLLLLGNPPTTPEGEWIVQYFAPWLDDKHPNPALPGELRWFVVEDDKSVEVSGPEPVEYKGETLKPRSRTFIPAFLDDNPFLRDTDYRATLQGLPDVLKQKFLGGKFNVKTIDDPWQVIPTSWVDAAQERWSKGERPNLALRSVGVDPARGGPDNMGIAKLYHEWFEIFTTPGLDVPDGPTAANKVIEVTLEDTPAPIYVDVIGIGSSVVDSLALLGCTVYPVNVAGDSTETDKTGMLRFANLRAEIHWKFREALDPKGEHAIALPPDRKLKVELCAARFKVTKLGIQIEAKEEIRTRIGRSPDRAECVLLAWHGVNAAAGFSVMVF